MQPELRAIDAFDPNERLIEYVRGYGVTTLHTGHGRGSRGRSDHDHQDRREDRRGRDRSGAMVAATLGDGARDARTPGSRAKAIALLRAELIKAQEYRVKAEKAEKGKEPARDLRSEAFVKLLKAKCRCS